MFHTEYMEHVTYKAVLHFISAFDVFGQVLSQKNEVVDVFPGCSQTGFGQLLR